MTLTVAPTSVFSTTTGQDVDIFPMVSECTVAQAAAFLDVTEGYINEVLDDNLIKHRSECGRCLIDCNELLEYKRERERGRAVLDEMARWDQEMGLYDD